MRFLMLFLFSLALLAPGTPRAEHDGRGRALRPSAAADRAPPFADAEERGEEAAEPPSAAEPPWTGRMPTSAELYWTVDDAWLRYAAYWVQQAEDVPACLQRLGMVAALGQRFLADQVAALVPLCGDSAYRMLRATSVLAPHIADRHNAQRKIVSLFLRSEDKQTARALLQHIEEAALRPPPAIAR